MVLSAFNRPQGICLQRDMLYVADTGNHSVRRIQLRSGDIDTICGAGRPGVPVEGVITDPRAVALDQPRAIALSAEAMHIATAGDNRIWTYNLGKRELRLLAGSGALRSEEHTSELQSLMRISYAVFSFQTKKY